MSELRLRATLFADMAKGGYLRVYGIFDGEKRVGSKTVRAETRISPVSVVYHGLEGDDRTFDNAKEFIAAYEEQKKGAA